jgi:hypothetical protein
MSLIDRDLHAVSRVWNLFASSDDANNVPQRGLAVKVKGHVCCRNASH